MSTIDSLAAPTWRPDLSEEARSVAIGLTILQGGDRDMAERWADEQRLIARIAGPQYAESILPKVRRAVLKLFRDLQAKGIDPQAYVDRILLEPAKRAVRPRRVRRRKTFRRVKRHQYGPDAGR